MVQKALILDRDGVINVDHGYVYKQEEFQFIDGIFELTSLAISKGYIIIVITNQAGIGRGFYSVKDFELLTNWMCKKFAEEKVPITKVYYSPFHPLYGIGEYKKDDESRKPRPGMIRQAVNEFHLNLSESVLIGDKRTDIEAGQSAGVGTNILYIGNSDDTPETMLNCQTIYTLNEAKFFLRGK